MDNDDATESCELQERLNQAVWPKRYMVEKFTKSSSIFHELRLTVSKAFPHNIIKLVDSVKTAGKCGLCRVRRTNFGCCSCKVVLCRSGVGEELSCFAKWHQRVDLMKESKKRKERNSGETMVDSPARNTRSQTVLNSTSPGETMHSAAPASADDDQTIEGNSDSPSPANADDDQSIGGTSETESETTQYEV
mmetsp:Transcript_1216/g.1863  ORF Transcript_1216/g.1863 Transcript_1216/m.1863 type:complete len:192 (+) Transcript_1216:297-872(+)